MEDRKNELNRRDFLTGATLGGAGLVGLSEMMKGRILAGNSRLLSSADAPMPGAEPSQKINVLFFALDQLRADRLHCVGNSRQTSPNIDRLAQRGVLFPNFFTVAPWTSPSFSALHTSLYPSRHGVTLDWRPHVTTGFVPPLIERDTPMMVPVFKDHGYYTTGFVNNSYAGLDVTGRGFDEYYEAEKSTQNLNVTERSGGYGLTGIETTKEVLHWLDRHKSENFFLYVHFMEPHSPYNPPPEDDIFKSGPYTYLFDRGYDIAQSPAKRLAMLGDQEAIARLYQLYDGKIHFIDWHVGQILDHLRSLGLEDNTLVVLTSDHGELLYSHPKYFQTFDHRSLFDTVLHIPLIMAGPGVPNGRVINALATNIDTAPTVLALAGIPPLPGAQGQSLVPLMRGTASSLNSYLFMEEDMVPPERAVRTLNYKLIRNLWTGEEMLFDVGQDPQENHNILQEKPRVAKELAQHLNEWIKQNTPPRQVQLRRFRIYISCWPDVIVTNSAIGGRFMFTGEGWHSDTAPSSGNYDEGCFWIEQGDGSRTAVWRTDDPMIGTYKISIYFGRPLVGRLATNAPFTVVTNQSPERGVTGWPFAPAMRTSETVRINFNERAGEWHVLGLFQNPLYVSLSNAADGAVVADTVRFEMVSLG